MKYLWPCVDSVLTFAILVVCLMSSRPYWHISCPLENWLATVSGSASTWFVGIVLRFFWLAKAWCQEVRGFRCDRHYKERMVKKDISYLKASDYITTTEEGKVNIIPPPLPWPLRQLQQLQLASPPPSGTALRPAFRRIGASPSPRSPHPRAT
jgi:hypothetical protein